MIRHFPRLMIPVWVLLITLTGCAANPYQQNNKTITLPLFPGWYEGQLVYYVTTEASDAAAAKRMGVNYAPRLKGALPPRPKPPGLKTVLERIYVFTNWQQPTILPSVPTPLGPESNNRQYSPLWQFYEVTWNEGASKREIKSEEELLKAEEAGEAVIVRTDLVVNCPIVKAGDKEVGNSRDAYLGY